MVDPYARSITWLEHLTSGKRWVLKATALLFALSMFFHFPSYNYLTGYLNGTELNPRWDAFKQQRDHPFTPVTHKVGSHQEKIAFRLTVPCMARIAQLGPVGVYAVQVVLGLIMIAMVLSLCERITGDRTASLLCAGGIVFTYAGSAAFFDVWGLFDAFAYFFLIMALTLRQPAAIAGAIFLACFTDERALIAAPLVLLFHLTSTYDANGTTRSRTSMARSIACAVAVVAYLVTRWMLADAFGLRTGTGNIGIQTFFKEMDQVAWGLWSGLEGQWLVVAAFFIVLWTALDRWKSLTWVLALGLVSCSAVMVWDVTRSMAYGFVVLFPAIAYLAPRLGLPKLRVLLFFACLVSLLHPMYFTFGQARVIPVDGVPLRALHLLGTWISN